MESNADSPEVKVTINAESIDSTVVKAILESQFGEKLEKVIAEELQGMTRGYGSGSEKLKQVVVEEIRILAISTVREEYTDKIKKAIREKLDDGEFMGSFVSKMWEQLMRDRY